MARSPDEILADIESFQPDNGNWLGLDQLLDELWSAGVPHSAIPVLFRVFDRFPDEDGAEVFWSLVHGLESLPGYESLLLEPASAHPHPFKQIMTDRLKRVSENERPSE